MRNIIAMNIKGKKTVLLFLVAIVTFLIVMLSVFGYELLDGGKDIKDSDRNLLFRKQEKTNYTELFFESNEIINVSTKYSSLYKDNDKRLMYVSSFPIKSYDQGTYIPINTCIDKIGCNSYITDNSYYSIHYEKEYVRIGNEENWFNLNLSNPQNILYCKSIEVFNGIVDGIKYSFTNGDNILVAPVYNGMLVKYHTESLDPIKLSIESPRYRINNDTSGTVILSEYGSDPKDIMANNYFIISSPLLYDLENQSKIIGKMEISERDGLRELGCIMQEDLTSPFDIVFFINLYCENMFFDCAAYEKSPRDNYIFDSYIVYDSISNQCQTNNYMKFNIRSFTPKKSELLDQILLNLNVLSCKGEVTIEVYSVKHDWCSWLLTWDKRPKNSEKIGEFLVNETGWYSIDLTDYTKHLIDENYYYLENNSIVFKIKEGSKGYVIFASGDNSFLPPYFEVRYCVK